MVVFYDQRLLKIGIHGNGVFIFASNLGVDFFLF